MQRLWDQASPRRKDCRKRANEKGRMIPLNVVEMIPSPSQSASEKSDTNETTKEPETVIPLQVMTRAQTIKEK